MGIGVSAYKQCLPFVFAFLARRESLELAAFVFSLHIDNISSGDAALFTLLY